MYSLIEDLRKVPVLRALFPLVLGIVFSNMFLHALGILQFGALALVLFFLIVVLQARFFNRKTIAGLLSGCLIFAFLLIVGIVLAALSKEKFQQDDSHILHITSHEGEIQDNCHVCRVLNKRTYSLLEAEQQFQDSIALNHKSTVVIGKIMDAVVEKERSFAVAIAVSHCVPGDSIFSFNQNVIVYISKDSVIPVMVPGELWAFGGDLKEIRNHGNPGEFDYRSYMQRKNFHYSLFVAGNSFAKQLTHYPSDLKYFPMRVRYRIMSSWNQKEQDIAILSALTLGNKSLLDRATKRSFSNAGAMHLLAVSGLHVGMVWWILDLLLWVPAGSRIRKTVKLIIILLILWFYAGITGFSASVSRSVLMFSLVAFSKAISRNSNIFNTLFLSAFILLVFNPVRIAEPGFQLSYLAVFGIITIHPVLSKFYREKSKIVKWFLDMMAVSIAAQIATLPLVLLYFHQFPVWFLLTNIVAIPLVSAILALFVLFAPFLICCPDIELFLNILKQLVHILDYLINAISILPSAVITDISLDPLVAIMIFVLFLITIAFVKYRQFVFLFMSLLSLVFVLIVSSIVHFQAFQASSLEVYNFRNATIISSLQSLERNTYVINHKDDQDPYVTGFLHTLNRLPGKVRAHNSFLLSDMPNADTTDNFCFTNGLWGIDTGTKKVLIIGHCDNKDIDIALKAYSWDMLVFVRGFPLNIEKYQNGENSFVVIGDGSLRDFEIDKLELIFNNAYFVGQKGAYRMSLASYE